MSKKITTAVAVVFNKKGKMLIVKNAKAGRWTLPGGQIDKGESHKQGAMREVFEETSLKISIGKKKTVTKRYSTKGRKCAMVYIATVKKGKVELSHEHTDFDFVKPKKAMKKLINRHSNAVDKLIN